MKLLFSVSGMLTKVHLFLWIFKEVEKLKCFSLAANNDLPFTATEHVLSMYLTKHILTFRTTEKSEAVLVIPWSSSRDVKNGCVNIDRFHKPVVHCSPHALMFGVFGQPYDQGDMGGRFVEDAF